MATLIPNSHTQVTNTTSAVNPDQVLAGPSQASTAELAVPAPRPMFKGPRGPVPYIAAWSAEDPEPVELVVTAGGIGYADETGLDRDADGVLWVRAPSKQGIGEPWYSRVHPLRQRKAMRKLLCQVCAGPADRNEQGTLWLLHDYNGDWENWPDGMANTHPPLCLRCAHMSVRMCPSLQPGFVAVRAQSTIVGVEGAMYRAGYPGPYIVGEGIARYTSPMIRWVQGAQLVRKLHECVVVEL